MKVAICFSGVVRTFVECWESYERYLLNCYDCDLFGASPPNDILHRYPFKKLLYQADEQIDEKYYPGNKSPETGLQNSLRQFYFIELSNRLRQEYERDKGVKYDLIIRTRFDNLMVGEVPLNRYDGCGIYIPEGHDHPLANKGIGINDRFAFGNDCVMNIYSDKLGKVDEYMAKSGRAFHPETILKWILDKNDLRIVRFPECTKINRGNGELL